MSTRSNSDVGLISEENQIHTNSVGETYGEAMAVKHLNVDVDLISAIGKMEQRATLNIGSSA